jgi:hypothetical protein
MRKPIAVAVMTIVLVLIIGAAAFVWNEARKEIVFLCGNFGPGVSKQSVLRQLETGHFLRYRLQPGADGERIVADSRWNLGRYRCTVTLDDRDTVTGARVE